LLLRPSYEGGKDVYENASYHAYLDVVRTPMRGVNDSILVLF
jgi:hypothetical protein